MKKASLVVNINIHTTQALCEIEVQMWVVIGAALVLEFKLRPAEIWVPCAKSIITKRTFGADVFKLPFALSDVSQCRRLEPRIDPKRFIILEAAPVGKLALPMDLLERFDPL